MTKNKKICFMITTLARNGAERVISILANRFAAMDDWEVHFIVKYPLLNEYALKKNICRINMFDDYKKAQNDATLCNQVMFIRKYCKENDIDILINFMAASNIKGLLATLGLKTKCVVSVRDDPNAEYDNFLLKTLANVLFPLANGIVFQTADEAAWFSKNIRKKGVIITNPVNSKFYLSDAEYENIKKRTNIVAVGRLELQKNYKMLLNAFSLLKREFPDEKLEIYGEGSLKNELEKMVEQLRLKDSVKLLGEVEDIPQHIKNAKMFVMTSNHEGIPNAMIEAMALGLPTICTDCPAGGPREYINDGYDGLLVPVGNIDCLVQAMRRLLENENCSLALGKAARKKAEMFKEDTVFKEWEKYIASCLSE